MPESFVSTKEFNDFSTKMTEALEEKVGYRHFYWVLGTAMAVITSVLAFQINLILRVDDKLDHSNDKIDRNSQQSTEIISDVGELKGQLKSWELIK